MAENSTNPLSALADMYNDEVAEHDKAGYADRLKEATELFFKYVNELFEMFNEDPVHFTSIEYLDGYFVLGFGTNTVIHFHVDECPGWKFGIWWDIPNDREDFAGTIHGQFFTQYEETIDKFKPSRSAICHDVLVRLAEDNKSCDCYQAHDVIKFIHTEPALAFCRDYCGWNYNAEYHTREDAERQFDEYKKFAANKAKYTAICDDKVLSFVRDKVLPQFRDAKICVDEGWSPRYHVVAPYESNKDLVDKPGTYSLFSNGKKGRALSAQLLSIVKECDAVADKFGFVWFEPVSDSVLFYGAGGEE